MLNNDIKHELQYSKKGLQITILFLMHHILETKVFLYSLKYIDRRKATFIYQIYVMTQTLKTLHPTQTIVAHYIIMSKL